MLILTYILTLSCGCVKGCEDTKADSEEDASVGLFFLGVHRILLGMRLYFSEVIIWKHELRL